MTCHPDASLVARAADAENEAPGEADNEAEADSDSLSHSDEDGALPASESGEMHSATTTEDEPERDAAQSEGVVPAPG